MRFPRVVLGVVIVGFAFGVASLGIGSSASAGPKRAADHSETTNAVLAAAIRRIVIDVRAGEITVTSTHRRDVAVQLTKKWMFSEPQSRRYVRNGALHLEGRCRHSVLCATNFKVAAPPGVAVDVRGDAAEIEVNGLVSSVSIANDTGDLTASLLRRPHSITAKSKVGDVHLTVPRGTYAVELHAGLGHEKIRGVKSSDNATRAIRASTKVGDITLQGR
jgi:hypothetical protein